MESVVDHLSVLPELEVAVVVGVDALCAEEEGVDAGHGREELAPGQVPPVARVRVGALEDYLSAAGPVAPFSTAQAQIGVEIDVCFGLAG